MKQNKGQALIVGLLVIFASSITLAVAASVAASSQISVNQNQKLEASAYNLASSCIENTLMRMGRGQFSAPQILLVGDGKCTINITPNSGAWQILSTAELPTIFNKSVTKKIQTNVSIIEGVTTVTSQQEVN